MAARALGYHEDPDDKRDWDIDKFGLASAPSGATEHSLIQYDPPIYNQFSSSSCVVQAIGGAAHNIEIQAAARGVNIAPSKLALLIPYYHSRILHSRGSKVTDTGTYVRTATSMLFKLGCADDRFYPFAANYRRRINRRPPIGATMRGLGRQGGKYYRIKETGQGRITALIAALHDNNPVCFGTSVTNGFLGSSGPSIIDAPGAGAKFAGGHAMVIIGYKVTANGLLFLVRNSWGTDWRDGGYCWMTEDYIRWFKSRDFQVIAGWALIQEAA